jgi:hypothetical protein
MVLEHTNSTNNYYPLSIFYHREASIKGYWPKQRMTLAEGEQQQQVTYGEVDVSG